MAVVLAAVVLTPVGAGGQEMAVFELDSFLAPTVLGMRPSRKGVKESTDVDEGYRFLSMKAIYGYVSDYQRRNLFTETDLGFLQLGGNYYSGRHQVGAYYTGFDESETSNLSDYRVRLQYGLYDIEESAGGETVDRWMISWTRERTPAEVAVDEIGIAFDALDSGSELDGTIAYNWTIVEGVPDEHRFSYVSRDILWTGNGGRRVTARYGISGERALGHWRWGSVRAEAAFRVPLRAIKSDLYVAWAPAYHFKSRDVDSGWNHELSIFTSARIVSKLFRPGGR